MLLHFILFLFTFPLTMVVGTFQGSTPNNTINPNCQTECGNVTVPYPFGIGINCSLDDSFNLTCDTSQQPPRLFIGNGNIEIYNISDTELRTHTVVASQCYNQSGYVDGHFTSWSNLTRHRAFTYSAKNRFIIVGCDDYAWIKGTEEDDFTSGCFGLCQKAPNVSDGQCSGLGCCQIPIPKGLKYYNATLYSFQDHSEVLSFNECGYGFLVEEGVYEFRDSDLSTNHSDVIDRIRSTMPRVLDWVITHNGSCTADVNKCQGNSSCYDVEGGRGYCCKCHHGYKGNPYLHPGCQGMSSISYFDQ
ncbi:putative EGF-like domain, wall-associated receptor kinase, galacturonan-binding protein [Helianthus annuus]|nr:putative EGF-like domain, wall-associated receptor kinase, galacturonan-binding protein [Helianthus annuus]